MKQEIIALPLLAILLIIGCTQSTNTQQTITTITSKGLSILNFTSNFNTLRVHESTNIRLQFKNNGDFPAENVTTILYGEGLLNKTSAKNFTNEILPNQEDIQFWLLEVPLVLSTTESTTYTLGARTYYYYNFSGFQQAGFVSTDYVGEDLPLSSGTSKGPLSVSISVRNPIRTLPDDPATTDIVERTIFTITATITDTEEGTIDYFPCTQPCKQGGHLNDLRLTVPSKWLPEPANSMSAWASTTNTETEETTYILNYKNLMNEYDKRVDFNDIYYSECAPETATCRNCSRTPETTIEPGYSAFLRCSKITEAISNLRLIRGDEARIVQQFSTLPVTETIIDQIKITGNYGYETDTNLFKKSIILNIRGD